MAQDMTVLLRAFNGEKRRVLSGGGDRLARILADTLTPEYPYLGLVDEYSNTYFTPMQMQAVIPELERLAAANPADADLFAEILDMASECRNATHVHLMFAGD